MTDAHRDELEALQAFLIKEHELTVLDAAPDTLAAACAAVKPKSVSLKGGTILKFRVTPSDADDAVDPPAFYLWLHVGWSAEYPTVAGSKPVLDLDDPYNVEYLDGTARRGLIAAMHAEVKDSGAGEPVTLSMLTVLKDELAKIPVKDRVRKSLFDTISSSKAADAGGSKLDSKHSATSDSAAGATGAATATGAKPLTSAAAIAAGVPVVINGITQPKEAEKTKKQKRRMEKHLNEKGEKKRGWNWVDLISHLSKTANT